MSKDMSFFMKGKAKQNTKIEEVSITDRFTDEKGNPIPFEMKSIDPDFVDQIMDQCTTVIKKKGKVIDEVLDQKRFAARLAVESTVYPNFKDKDLLASYKQVDPILLAKEILSIPGEYNEWLLSAQRINGFEEDFDDLVEEAKN